MIDRIRFTVQNIINNASAYSALFVQITISFIILGFSAMQYNEISDFAKAMSGVLNTDNLYFIQDNTDYNKFAVMEENEKYREKWEELYSFIYNSNEYDAYCLSEDSLFMDEKNSPEIFHSGVGSVEFNKDHNTEYKRISSISSNENFIKSFGLKCKEGRIFNSEDMNKNSRNIILGSNFSKDFKVGDKITIMDEEYNVVGILQEKSFYLKPTRTSSVLYLDNCIIYPFYLYIDEEDNGNSFYTNAIQETSFYSENVEKAEKISLKAKELNLMELEIKCYKDKYDDLRNMIQNNIAITASIAAIILIFAVICMICALLLIVQRQMDNFIIHYMYGATLSNIISQIGTPVVVIIFLAFIITSVVYDNVIISSIIFLFSIVISFLIICIPAIKLKRVSLGTMLKRRD